MCLCRPSLSISPVSTRQYITLTSPRCTSLLSSREGISVLPSRFPTRLKLHHTTPANLLDADSRLAFIKDFIAVVRCLADGGAPIGYLRRDGGKIHRTGEEESEGEEYMTPPQECLDERGIAEWRKEKAIAYAL